MKAIKFEKVSNKLTKEEMNYIQGGYTLAKGDTHGGDTYGGGNAWQRDANGDVQHVTYSGGEWAPGATANSTGGTGAGSASGSGSSTYNG